jgi:hypothetical protein
MPLVATVALIGATPGAASAVACPGWTVTNPPSPSHDDFLTGVAVVPSGHAWAVGSYINSQGNESSLIAHWNGTTWNPVRSPNPGGLAGNNYLWGVAAISSARAWAVGTHCTYSTCAVEETLILRWNGTTWKRVPSPPGGLFGVAGTSPTSAWAVGAATSGSLILRWNGTRWRRVHSPPGGGLTAVTAVSRTDAWAVGCTGSGCAVNGAPGQRTMILHWNGTAWKRVPSPNPAGPSDNNFLFGVAATSSTNAWAVGYYTQGGDQHALILHWNGTAWRRVRGSVSGRFDSGLSGIAAISSRNAWAVGDQASINGGQTLVAHWNGTAWKQVPTPNTGIDSLLLGVAAPSSTDVWAVGSTTQPEPVFSSNLALHHC